MPYFAQLKGPVMVAHHGRLTTVTNLRIVNLRRTRSIVSVFMYMRYLLNKNATIWWSLNHANS